MKFPRSLRIAESAPQRVNILLALPFILFMAAFSVHIFAVDPMLVSKFEKQLSDPSLKALMVYVTTSILQKYLSSSSNCSTFFGAMFAHPLSKIEKKYFFVFIIIA